MARVGQPDIWSASGSSPVLTAESGQGGLPWWLTRSGGGGGSGRGRSSREGSSQQQRSRGQGLSRTRNLYTCGSLGMAPFGASDRPSAVVRHRGHMGVGPPREAGEGRRRQGAHHSKQTSTSGVRGGVGGEGEGASSVPDDEINVTSAAVLCAAVAAGRCRSSSASSRTRRARGR